MQYMPAFTSYADLYILTTSSDSHVLIDTWMGKGNLDLCIVQNQN